MQLPDLSKIQTRLVTFGGIVVAGTLCPVGIGAMAAAVASGIVANDLVADHLSRISTRLRNADEKLANHDLTHAVGLAIALIIQSFAEADIYPRYKKDLEALAKTAVKDWQIIAEATKGTPDDDFAQIQDEEISALFSQKSEEFFKQPVLTLDAWKSLVKDWLSRVANKQLPEDVVEELAKQLQTKFPLALREVLKEDFESGGKAFAGLTLSMLGEINATLREQQQLISNDRGNNSQPSQDITQLSADVQIAIQQVETLSQQLSGINSSVEEIKVKAEQNFQQLGNQINSGFADVLREMGLSEERIKEVLRELKAEMQSWFQQVIDGQKTLIEGQKEIKQAVIESREINQEYYEGLVRLIERMEFGISTARSSSSFSDTPPTITNWQGRIEEIQQLTAWLNDENNQFIGIVGFGGVGKSTLAAKLYEETAGFEGKFWADVSQNPAFTILGRRILMQFGYREENAEKVDESRLVEVLVNCLRERRFLLVIDNLETLLQTGGGWKEPVYQQFFTRWIECCGKSEVLVTSQDIPKLDQVHPCWVKLKGMKAEEGMALLKSFGIQGTDAELRKFVEKVEGYPLLLKLVAGLLNAEMGKNAKITDLEVLGLADLSQLMTDPRIKGRHRQETVQIVTVLEASFNRLSEKLQQILLKMSVDRWQNFDVTKAKAVIDEGVSVEDLRDLVNRSLLEEERININQEWWFNFQPLIRVYASQKAIEFLQQSLEIAREMGDRSGEARCLSNLGSAYNSLGEYHKAIEFLQQSLEIVREIGDRQGEADSLNKLGLAYYCLGEHQQEIEFYEQSLKIAREMGDRKRESAFLNDLVIAYLLLREYQKAIKFYQQSLEIAREMRDRYGEARCLSNLGSAYNSLREYQKAIEFYQQSLEIAREMRDRYGEARCLSNLGSAYNSLREYQKAIEFYQQSLEIAREIGDRSGEGGSLCNIGNAYESLGEYPQAINYYEQALVILRDIGHRRFTSNTLIGLGNAYLSLREYPQAINFYQQSLEIAGEIGEPQGEAKSLYNLGIAYLSLKEYQQAIEFYQQALVILRDIGDRELTRNTLMGLGNAYLSLREYPQAINFYEQSLEIVREMCDRSREASHLQILSQLYHQTCRIKEGFAAGYQAVQILQELDIPIEGMPYPNWMKLAIKLTQRGKWQIALCFVAGLITFPFALVWIVALTIWRLIRTKLNRN